MPLLEREAPLELVLGHLDEAAAGHGRFVVVAGEAGAGKTSFVDALVRRVGTSARVALGGCDGSATPAALAPLVEMLPELPAGVWPDGATRQQVFGRLRAALADPPDTRPYLVVVEDAHWADEATLDLLRHLARRAHRLHALVVVTFRPEDVTPNHPLRVTLGDVATASGLRRVDLPALSVDAVRVLMARVGAAPGLDATQLHRVTGGNAFFVTEALAAGGEAVPPTVRDAVLARTARLSEAAQRALDVVALVGTRAEPDLLAELLPEGLDVLDEPLARHVLQLVGGDVAFRHELARLAVAEQVPAFRRVAIHRGILAALESGRGAGEDPARLAHHAEAAARRDAVGRYAPLAASRAASLGAHREAVQQYRRALRAADELPAHERAVLLGQLSYECYLTDEGAAALDARRAALLIWQEVGDRVRVGDTHRWLSRLLWFAGQQTLCREHARLAVDALAGTDGVPLAMAYSNLAQIEMLAGHLPATRQWAGRALAVLDRLPPGDEVTEVRVHANNNLGAAETLTGDLELGLRLLADSLAQARAADLQEHAARAYCNLVSTAVTQHRHGSARELSDEGLDYCLERDLDSWAVYLQGWRAQLLLDEGDVRGALSWARAALGHPGAAPINRINPLAVLARVQAGRGRDDWAQPLRTAAELADGTGELQRVAPVVAARAETAWIGGDEAGAHRAAADAWTQVADDACPWQRGMIATWLGPGAGGSGRTAPDNLAPPYAAEVEGRWDDAGALWRALSCPQAEAMALARGGTREGLARATELFEQLGLVAAADRARAIARGHGWSLPRGPRASTRSHPAGLTARESQIVPLLAAGLSDASIAERLVVSRRTVEHHVGSILAKLGVASRHEITAEPASATEA